MSDTTKNALIGISEYELFKYYLIDLKPSLPSNEEIEHALNNSAEEQ